MKTLATFLFTVCSMISASPILSPAATAGVVLEVDLSDPAQTVITATEAFSEQQIGPTSAFNGVTLRSLFSDNATIVDYAQVSAGSLNAVNDPAAESRFALTSWFVGNYPGGWTPDDLNFFENFGFEQLFFSTDLAALTGSVTLDLSSLSGLPGVGATGDIVVGVADDEWAIGQWLITGQANAVPVSGTLPLFGLGAIVMVLTYGRRTANAS